jgi:hypothetical protein
MKSTLEKIIKWGHFKDSKWVPHKIETFRGARDFFGPFNGTSDSEGHSLICGIRLPCSVDKILKQQAIRASW